MPDMKLYKATYAIKWSDSVVAKELSQYILAPDFQTAGKLAETSKRITSKSGGSGNPIVGDISGMLLKVEEIASDVSDFQNAAKLADIGSYMFSIVDTRLLKVELLAINVIQE
jgi:hypothetical protein